MLIGKGSERRRDDGGRSLPPLLIGLPDGINVSGVTMWAVRLANALVERGGEAGLVVHPEPRGQGRVGLKIDPRVRRFSCGERFGDGGNLSRVVGVYEGAVRELAREGGPVVVSPNLHGDCYGVAARLTQLCDVRIVGWQHSDNEYDARVLAHYADVVARFVGVSDAIVGLLRERLRGVGGAAAGVEGGMEGGVEEGIDTRLGEACHPRVVNIPYGVVVPGECPARRRSGVLRLVYTGRMEHRQKRVTALVFMSGELRRRGVAHTLTLIGDGPAAGEVDRMIEGCPEIRRLAPLGPLSVAAMLEEHDALVLPSRFEGLSVSVLEAMARGCVPIVARTRSGAGLAVGEERDTGDAEPSPGPWNASGIVVDVSEEAEEEEVGVAMAAVVERFTGMDREGMSHRAWERARACFSMEGHVEKVERVLREVVAEPARVWGRERAWAFSGEAVGGRPVAEVERKATWEAAERGVVDPSLELGARVGSGSVPADGAARMKALLESLAGRAIVIHGTGEHTRQLKDVIVNAPVRIVAFADDDRGKHGTRLWDWPVISPREAGRRGATDVVISSWMHQEAVWGRRGVYEGMGLRVWRVY